MLCDAYEDVTIAGKADILAYIERLGIRTAGGYMPSWRTLLRWQHTRDFPLYPGVRGRHTFIAALTSVHAITAWMLTQPKTGRAFRVDTPYWRAWRESRRAKQVGSTAPETAQSLSAQSSTPLP